jgi:hypothetical protein
MSWSPVVRVDFGKLLHTRQKRELSNLLTVTGDFRVGKTTLAIYIARDLMEKQGKKLDLSSQLTLLPHNFENLIHINPTYSALIFDEAHLFFSSSNYWDKYNRSLKRAIALTTDKYQTLIFTLPNLKRLYPDIKDVLNFELKVVDKGKSRIYQIKDGKKEYLLSINFDRLNDETYNEYLDVRDKELKEVEGGENISTEEKAKQLYNELKSYAKVAKKLNKSKSSVWYLVNR